METSMDRLRHYIFRQESVARTVLVCALFLPLLTAQAATTLSVVYSFAGVNGDGGYPYAGAVLSSTGIIFGTTEYGGTAGLGTVFQLSPPVGGHGPWTEKVIHDFTGTDGAYPYA